MECPASKYRAFEPVDLPDRQWPGRRIEQPPIWVSVDLRDGNQALVQPMDVGEKLELFQLLVALGFKEIEIGFPSASQTEFDFVRLLIDRNLIPGDVWVQVLTPAREHLIRRTVESLYGCERAIVHLYNSTSAVQRRVVFGMDEDQVVQLAVDGTQLVKHLCAMQPRTHFRYEYSPESFTATELWFAKRICESVLETWQPTEDQPVILNLPATVELATPNIYADQIEWMCRNVVGANKAIISVHTHNDRGCAVAAAEFAQMAGATRVEGTLFGYGERTGNVDLVTLALNLYSQGIDPHLDLGLLDDIGRVVSKCTDETVHPRHPYSGELVFTAFSGSHQDAISKGMKEWEGHSGSRWEVPYIPIDPKDIGRDYRSIIRVNSQSGKGGAAYILRERTGLELPRAMQAEFGHLVQERAERSGSEVPAEELVEMFFREYVGRFTPYELILHEEQQLGEDVACHVVLCEDGRERAFAGRGNGPIAAFADAIQQVVPVEILGFHEHSLGSGAGSKAAAYIRTKIGDHTAWGVGIDVNSSTASMRAILSAVNRIQDCSV
jgi:2-isopropylmalate synthase